LFINETAFYHKEAATRRPEEKRLRPEGKEKFGGGNVRECKKELKTS
jgi:hypothetical protein